MRAGREQTPHEKRINALSTRDRLVFRLIRRIATLMGRGKAFDADCEYLASLTDEELQHAYRLKIDELRKHL